MKQTSIKYKTHNDSPFNPQILLLKKPNLNACFLHILQLDKENQVT